MRAQISNRDYEQLSAYIDGQLSSGEQQKLEERLRVRPELQAVLDDLKRTKMLLRMAPHRRAPRSFTLTPAMVGTQKAREKHSFLPNLFPALSFASAIALFALVASLLFEFLPGSFSTMTSNREAKEVAMQPAPGMAPEATAGARTQAEEDTTSEAAPQAAAPQSAAPAAMPTATPALGALEAPATALEKSTGEAGAASPPIVIWQSPAYGLGGGGGGPEGGVSQPPGEYAPAPKVGIGGGAADFPSQSMAVPDGAIVIPLEGINSLEQGQTAADQPMEPERSQAGDAIHNGGPILGIPAQEEGGTIRNKSAWGEPFEGSQEQAAPLNEVTGAEQARSNGLSFRYLQLILAILAIATGAAALILHRRNAV
jgi:anti-sigma factor RsiW